MLAVHPHNLTPAQALAACDTHGLGIIHDATEARLIRRVNGDRSLRLTCPWTEKNANLLIADRLICYDGQYYRITIPTRRERGGKKAISLEAPHVMYDLRHSYIVNIETAEDEETIDGITGTQALMQVLAGTPFTPGTVDIDAVKLEYLDLLEVPRTTALEQIIDRWGGEIVPDNWTINLREQSGVDRGLQIRVGKNIDGVEMTEDINEVVTRLHVLGYQGANFESINGGKNYLDSDAIGRYAFVREGYVTFDDDEDPEILMQKGLEELDKLDKPKLSVRIDMIRVRGGRHYQWYADLERVDEGDTVTVHHEFLGQNVKLRAMEVETDCLTGIVLSVTLADAGTDGLFQGFSSFVRTTELVRKILDHDGHVRARTLRGEIDLLTTRLIASGSYQNASVIAGKGALLENTNESSPDYGALYIGPGILAIADSKSAGGAWEWRTFGTGKGFSGSEILAYSISGTKIMAHTIGVTHLMSEVITEVVNNSIGQQMVMELSKGTMLDVHNPVTTARLIIYDQGQDVTEDLPDADVRWEMISGNTAGDAAFNADPAHIGTKEISVSIADITSPGILRCIIDSAWTGQIDTDLDNLKTSSIGLSKAGMEVYADGHLLIRPGGGFDLATGSGTNYMRLTNMDPDIRMIAGGETKATAPFWVAPDGGIKATKLMLTNSQISEFTQMYPYAAAENADPSNPVIFRIFVPAELVGIQSLKLSYILEAFRAYETGAAAGGGTSVTSESGGGATVTSGQDSAGRNTKASGEFETGGPSVANTGSGGTGATGSGSAHTHTITNHRHSYTMGASDTGYTQPGATNEGSHTHSGPSHTHSMQSHTHTVGEHVHGLNQHTHSVSISAHSHTVTLADHTHTLVYGIYQGPTATAASVKVDGVTIGSWASQISLDITEHLTKAAGKVTRDAWHTIEIIPNSLSRIVAQCFLIALVNQANAAVY